jgi:glycosyltransferase involved in cell wall biosynthesis
MMNWSLNQAVIARISPCDVFIFMSGAFLEASLHARRRFGAKLIIERGSQHILSQRKILAATAGAYVPSDYEVDRELRGYEIADIISIPSRQVAASFECDQQASAKLMVNPYGVDLQQFPLKSPAQLQRKTVLFVGNWTFQKGVDVLSAAIEQLNDVFLVHVGAIGDAPFPTHPRFTTHGAVPQWALTHFYSNAHVFVIASRHEGLALVQAQALASGLPLVCTDRTGGDDLAHSPALAARIRVVPHGCVEELRQAIAEYLNQALSPAGFAPLPESERRLLSWSAYGQRYAKHLGTLMATPMRSWPGLQSH